MIQNERGFTIVELMVSSMVFSVIMLLAAGVVVRFTSNFQKGMIETSTQNVARSIIEAVSNDIQFSGNKFSPLAGGNGYCLGSTRYSFVLGSQLENPASKVLTQEQGTGINCSGPASESQELLSPNMRLAKFNIEPNQNQRAYTLTVKVAYGDDDLLDNPNSPNVSCKATKGSQFCAVRELSTTVIRRL